MIIKKYILSNLRLIDKNFKNAKNQEEALLLSKLAIIELCGWIEQSMDDIVRHIYKRCLKDVNNCKFVEKEIIKKTYGFEYHKHFRGMLTKTIGIVNVERIELSINQTKKAKLEAVLSTLKKLRDAEAHTYIEGTMHTVNAPSVTLAQFTEVYDGLNEICNNLRTRKF